MKEYKHLGSYGLIIKNQKILLIKKFGGPYDGKLDLPGGTIEFCEKPDVALKRELLEEVGIEIKNYELFDADSDSFEWDVQAGASVKVHHIGIFYKISEYTNEIKEAIAIDDINDDSLGAAFYEIKKLTKNNLSKIAIMELKKLGYSIK